MLVDAFAAATEGAINSPNPLQQAVFPRLLTRDTGLVVSTEPCAGRLEAVFIPYMTGLQPGRESRRLFVIGADHCPLDDYIYRLTPYLRALVMRDSLPRTMIVDGAGDAMISRRYVSDGSYEADTADHPFLDDVNLVVSQFSTFRSLFFGSGGIHALPEALAPRPDDADTMRPRDLFYFDEAFGEGAHQFQEFIKLVELLFAEDMDVIIGTSTMSRNMLDELAFLEHLTMTETDSEASRTIQTVACAYGDVPAAIESQVARCHSEGSRLCVIMDEPDRARSMYRSLADAHSCSVFLYLSSMPLSDRMRSYAAMRSLEKQGEGYVLVADGPAMESADLDVSTLIMEPCGPLALSRRAGRCNRRGGRRAGQMILIGQTAAVTGQLSPDRTAAFRMATGADGVEIPYDAAIIRSLVG